MKNKKSLVWLGVATLLVAVLIAVGTLWRVEHVAVGKASGEFTLTCDFDKFRQIMVRKDATNAVVDHAGMRLISQKIVDIDIDASADERPLLNAIRGRSQSTLAAEKILVVQLNDPEIQSGELVLRQLADIQPTRIQVETESQAPAGQVDHYITRLQAAANGPETTLTLATEMRIRLRVPLLFKRHADRRVQQSCERGLAEQGEAINQFIRRYADERVILPDV